MRAQQYNNFTSNYTLKEVVHREHIKPNFISSKKQNDQIEHDKRIGYKLEGFEN